MWFIKDEEYDGLFDGWVIGWTWFAGSDNTFVAEAYIMSDEKCPGDTKYDWFYFDKKRELKSAGKGLGIWNKRTC